MAYRKCSRCEKQQSAFGPGVLIQEFNGADYCADCLKIVKEENPSLSTSTLDIKLASPEQLQAILLSKTDAILQESKKQTNSLNSIKSTLTFFAVIVIIGLIVQGCSAIMNY
jgi:hypothetical protein